MINETIDLGDNWIAVKIPDRQIQWNTNGRQGIHCVSDNWSEMSPIGTSIHIKHKCCEIDKWGKTSAVVHPMQKNTHKIRGVSFRCHNCKTPAPKKVLFFIKLHKLYEKVNG